MVEQSDDNRPSPRSWVERLASFRDGGHWEGAAEELLRSRHEWSERDQMLEELWTRGQGGGTTSPLSEGLAPQDGSHDDAG